MEARFEAERVEAAVVGFGIDAFFDGAVGAAACINEISWLSPYSNTFR